MTNQVLKTVAKTLGINDQTINQVLQASNNYSQDINGLIKAVEQNGGLGQLDKAIKSMNNPLVSKGLEMLGIDKTQITSVYNEIKGGTKATSVKANVNNYLDRLNSLK